MRCNFASTDKTYLAVLVICCVIHLVFRLVVVFDSNLALLCWKYDIRNAMNMLHVFLSIFNV